MQVKVVAVDQWTITVQCTTAAASWLKDYMQNAHTDGPDSEDAPTAGMRKEFFDAMAEVLGPSPHNSQTPNTTFFEDTPY
jgi:hypothetical protein